MEVLRTAGRFVIRDWLQANHKDFQGRYVPSVVLDAWMTDAEQSQFVIEIPSHQSVCGAPVTLNLKAYAVPLLQGGAA